MSTDYAVYIRASTDKQADDHQRESIKRWLSSEGLELADTEMYVDIGSGVSDAREQFQSLMDDIEAGEYETVICWEISRISRSGETLQRFFNLCEETDTTIVITDGAVERITPDGQNRFVADIIGMVYQQEHRTLVRRTKAGVKRARDEGKWLGTPPAGFKRNDEGYLRPIVDPDDGEVSFFEIQDALERIDSGDSYNSVAKSLPISRQALSNIHQDTERLSWYLDGTADDSRVQEALEPLN
ncbi:hypothetical protein JCM18237_12580 [Halorubrum luteum]